MSELEGGKVQRERGRVQLEDNTKDGRGGGGGEIERGWRPCKESEGGSEKRVGAKGGTVPLLRPWPSLVQFLLFGRREFPPIQGQGNHRGCLFPD